MKLRLQYPNGDVESYAIGSDYFKNEGNSSFRGITNKQNDRPCSYVFKPERNDWHSVGGFATPNGMAVLLHMFSDGVDISFLRDYVAKQCTDYQLRLLR